MTSVQQPMRVPRYDYLVNDLVCQRVRGGGLLHGIQCLKPIGEDTELSRLLSWVILHEKIQSVGDRVKFCFSLSAIWNVLHMEAIYRWYIKRRPGCAENDRSDSGISKYINFLSSFGSVRRLLRGAG